MASLTGQTVASTYPILLKIETSPLNTVFKTVEAGDGTDSALQLATTGIKSQGTFESTGAAVVGGAITVTGLSTLNAGATITGAVTVSTTLGVTGVLTATGGVVGALTGAVTGNTAGVHTGAVTGNVTGDTAGTHTGAVVGNVTGNTAGVHTGAVVGNVTGDTAGIHTGAVTGNVTGNTAGVHTGAVTGNVTGNTAGVHTGAVTGNVTGDTAGTHTGAVVGNATTATTLATARNIQVSGDVTGTASFDGSANINIAATLVAQAVPAGSVFNFAASTAPTGYLECSGAAVSRATYAALFAVTSTTFGVGDGSTTFNLPNLRGEFVRGWDNGRGVDASRSFGSAQGGLVESHNHTNGAFDQLLRITGSGTADGSDNSAVEPDHLISGTIQPYGGTETRPRNIAMLYCIKT